MPRIIDYPDVFKALLNSGFESLYHNSGAFGFSLAVPTQSIGWLGAPDPTLRPAALPLARQVPPPHAENMAALATGFWLEHLPGPVWLLPKSHWAYELDFGNGDWLPPTLLRAGVAPDTLAGRNDGSAVEFDVAERASFQVALQQVIQALRGSDFALAWPGRAVTCTVHHHRQLWWTTSDAALYQALEGMTSR